MATTPNTTRETVNEAASEAIRATSEASRRTLLGAQDAMRTTRTYMAESTEANRKLFNAYVKGCEAAMRNTFEVQNAVFAAGMSFIDASAGSSRNVVQQWTEATRQAQQATLEAWQAGCRAAMKYSALADAAEQQ